MGAGVAGEVGTGADVSGADVGGATVVPGGRGVAGASVAGASVAGALVAGASVAGASVVPVHTGAVSTAKTFAAISVTTFVGTLVWHISIMEALPRVRLWQIPHPISVDAFHTMLVKPLAFSAKALVE